MADGVTPGGAGASVWVPSAGVMRVAYAAMPITSVL
jgi:hypothetical protein